MGAVLQSEIRLHEGILASLSLQAAADQHLHERAAIVASLQEAIDNFKAAVHADETSGQIQDRRLHLLFNLEELIGGLKVSYNSLLAQKHKVRESDTPYSALLSGRAAALSKEIDWLEDLAEGWSLSLDEARMSEIKSRLIESPKAPSDIRDWRTVLDEVADDAEVHD